MKYATFMRLSQEILAPVLQGELGFLSVEGRFFRSGERGLVHLVLLDLDRGGKSFRVLFGVDSVCIDHQDPQEMEGAYFVLYLTRQGLSRSPQSFPCSTEEVARDSLQLVAEVARKVGEAWLERYSSPRDLAEVLDDRHLFEKGVLWLNAGEKNRAAEYLKRYLTTLRSLDPDPEVDQAIQRAEGLLSELGSTS